MQWLETFVVTEAGAGFVLASMNCRHLLAYARVARSAARRTGARAMALVSAALALESIAYVASPALDASPELRDVSLLAVRSGLLLASAVVGALLLRGGRPRA